MTSLSSIFLDAILSAFYIWLFLCGWRAIVATAKSSRKYVRTGAAPLKVRTAADSMTVQLSSLAAKLEAEEKSRVTEMVTSG
jgi:hypothetical protein